MKPRGHSSSSVNPQYTNSCHRKTLHVMIFDLVELDGYRKREKEAVLDDLFKQLHTSEVF